MLSIPFQAGFLLLFASCMCRSTEYALVILDKKTSLRHYRESTGSAQQRNMDAVHATWMIFMTCRLGFAQQPFVVDWQQAPPASSHARTRSILAAAAGWHSLNLKTRLQVQAYNSFIIHSHHSLVPEPHCSCLYLLVMLPCVLSFSCVACPLASDR